MFYFAHSSKDTSKQWQLLSEHLLNTAQMASIYASKFNASEIAFIAGLLHDIGKYSHKFQEKLKGKNVRIDHSTAGARESINLFGEALGKIIAYCISGHHSGLLDHGSEASCEGTLISRLNNKQIEKYDVFIEEIGSKLEQYKKTKIRPYIKLIKDQEGFSISFYIKMIFSCLVDADFIDTERYMESEGAVFRNSDTGIQKLCDRFDCYLSELKTKDTGINQKRNEILKRCIQLSSKETGLFTLTVPTGGGKTLSSMAFALNHAVKNNLERVIYVIPYTSIIEQNAKVFKDILGLDNVLEHHSCFQFDSDDTENCYDVKQKLKYSAENWEIPIVVTTNVQFFESLFSNKSSKSRKVHNISRSVVIFDEAQMLPVQYLRPCISAICELVCNYNTTAVLCTATQPAIKSFLPDTITPVEIIDNPRELYNDFKKVIVYRKNEMTDEELINQINQQHKALCIVNTRKHAKEIYKYLKGKRYHLSALMCPVHRQQVIKQIKDNLKNSEESCRVISTQLIEAGVDIDFPVVYRAMAGIDSIVQSAGRCNREGLLKAGSVFVFKPISKYSNIRGYLQRTAQIAEMVFNKYDDPISLEAIEYYFSKLFEIEGKEGLDKNEIINCFQRDYKSFCFDFQTAAERFRLIDSNTRSIVIPYDKMALDLIEKAKYTPFPRSIERQLQPYTVSVYENEYNNLANKNKINIINDYFSVLKDFENNYSDETGLILDEFIYGEGIFA